jgi:predicted dehydrogenase
MMKIGILGSGFVADFHMQSFREIGDAKVVAVGSRSRSDDFAAKWGIQKAFKGPDFIEKVCSDSDVEVVDVALPNFLHLSAVKTCAEKHKDVIVEKPLGRNASEAHEMLKAVNASGVLHAYAENQLYVPQIQRAWGLIRNGAIGKVFHVRSREAHFGPHSDWFWDKSLSGGGALLDMGCHSVEVTRKLIGKQPTEVFGWTHTYVHEKRTKAEDESLTLVKYGDGELGQAENSWTAHGGLDLRYEVFGSEGAIFVDVTRETGIRTFSVASEEKVGYIVEKAEVGKGWLNPTWREFELFGYLDELKDFVDSFRKGELPKENFNDGLEVNRILDAAYKSASSGRWEPLTTTSLYNTTH